jgi:ParB family chromosome partitioning protein
LIVNTDSIAREILTLYFYRHQIQDAVRSKIEEIGITEFDLSLSSMRLINLDRVAGLERSMKVHGQLQPVIARIYEGGVQMIDGFKRLYAAETLLIDRLECRLFEVDERQAKIMLMSYNWTNQSMEVWEEAMVLKALLEGDDLDQRQLAKLVGRSPSWVSRRLSLINKLDEEVASEIRMGSLTSRHARALMRLPRGNQIDVARVISDFHLSSRLSERLVDAYLEAEDKNEQRMLLDHPEYVLWHQWDLPEDPYDGRLSNYGNELMHTIIHLWQPLDAVLSTLGDSRIGDLGESEKAIIYPFLGELNDLTEKIMSATNKLQTPKYSK